MFFVGGGGGEGGEGRSPNETLVCVCMYVCVCEKEGGGIMSLSCSAEDDLYLAYATVHSKPSTYLLTNDNQGSVRFYLPESCHNIFHQWLRTRTARVIRLRRQYKIQVRGGEGRGGGRILVTTFAKN